MSRLVNDSQAAPESFSLRVIKYIPVEAIALYLAVENIIRGLPAATPARPVDAFIAAYGAYILFFAVWLATPFYLALQKCDAGDRLLIQILLALILFPVWVYALDGLVFDAQHWSLHSFALAAVLLPLATLLSGVIPNRLALSDLKAPLNFRRRHSGDDNEPVAARA